MLCAGAQSLYDYCSDLLSRGKCQLVCASCSAEWPYSVVREVARLTQDERQHFEQMLSNNALRVMQGPTQLYVSRFTNNLRLSTIQVKGV